MSTCAHTGSAKVIDPWLCPNDLYFLCDLYNETHSDGHKPCLHLSIAIQ